MSDNSIEYLLNEDPLEATKYISCFTSKHNLCTNVYEPNSTLICATELETQGLNVPLFYIFISADYNPIPSSLKVRAVYEICFKREQAFSRATKFSKHCDVNANAC